MKPRKNIVSSLVLAFSLLSGFTHLANAQVESAGSPTNIPGKVVSLKGPELIVASANGDVKVAIGDKTVIRGEVPIKFSEITSGMFVGATATKQADGTFLASQVNIFSEDQRGTGEGHRPLGSATMTNANIDRIEDVTVRDIKGRHDEPQIQGRRGERARAAGHPDKQTSRRRPQSHQNRFGSIGHCD